VGDEEPQCSEEIDGPEAAEPSSTEDPPSETHIGGGTIAITTQSKYESTGQQPSAWATTT